MSRVSDRAAGRATWLDGQCGSWHIHTMEENADPNVHLLEIPLASNGSAKLILRARTVATLVKELTEAAAAIETIAQLAAQIVTTTCGRSSSNTKGAS